MKYEQEMYYVNTYLSESKTSGKPYRMYTLIGEDKKAIEIIAENVNMIYDGDMFDKVLCELDLQTGRYMQLKLLNIVSI